MRKTLTAAMVSRTRPPPTGRVEILDTVVPQMALRVTANGAKSYVLRTRVDGDQFRWTIGDATAWDLKAAREEASEVLRKCKRGIDPREERREQRRETAAAEGRRFDRVVDLFMRRYASKNRSALLTRRIFDNHVLPRWRDKQIDEITRAEVVELLDAVEDGAGLYAANRTLATVRKLFNWALAERAMIDTTPIIPGMARKGEKSRERYLSAEEVGLVWHAAGELSYPFGPFVQLLLATGQRRSEVAGMRWTDLDLEGEVLWTLPADATKAGREHAVPLSDLALGVIREVPRVSEDYVFTTRGDRPISGFGKAKEKIDKEILEQREEPLPDWRFHDLRRTMATHMEDTLGIAPHIVGAVLNHDPKRYRGVTATYTRGRLIEDRRRALGAWASYLERIIHGGKNENIVALDERRTSP
jgi:integrase